MIEAILWDNDGVLVDTEGLFFEATRRTFVSAGTDLTRAEFIDAALRSGRNLWERVAAKGYAAERIARLRRERDELYAALLESGDHLIQGAADTVRLLAVRYRMGIVTTSLRTHLEAAHRRTGLLAIFEIIVAREDYEESKPHPEPYLTALARLSVPPEKCLAIEDSERGLASALAAGLPCVVIPNALTRGSDFAGAAAILDDITALPQAVSQIRSQAL